MALRFILHHLVYFILLSLYCIVFRFSHVVRKVNSFHMSLFVVVYVYQLNVHFKFTSQDGLFLWNTIDSK